MQRYLCPRCGKPSYSSAEEADQIDPRCPYCGCDPREYDSSKILRGEKI